MRTKKKGGGCPLFIPEHICQSSNFEVVMKEILVTFHHCFAGASWAAFGTLWFVSESFGKIPQFLPKLLKKPVSPFGGMRAQPAKT